MKKNLRLLTLCFLIFTTEFDNQAQGTFQNLGFEGANNLPNLNPPTLTALVPISDALPSWSAYVGTSQVTGIWYNGVSGGSALISLIGQLNPNYRSAIISGNYTAVLAAGRESVNTSTIISAAIAQSSLVPVSAQSLRFSLGNFSSAGALAVSFNGQNIPIFPLSDGPDYQIYGGDISPFAGSSGELRFTEYPLTDFFKVAYLDSIQFSLQPIPEPSVIGLIGLGALFLGWRWRRKIES